MHLADNRNSHFRGNILLRRVQTLARELQLLILDVLFGYVLYL